MVPGAHPHSNAVAIDMAIAYLAIEALDFDPRGRMVLPSNIHGMSLKSLLAYIKMRRAREGTPRQKLFNDNTINLACIAATRELAPSGSPISKEDATSVYLAITTQAVNRSLLKLSN